MTWQCDVKRSDEIGVLALSLNTMATRLKASMEELEMANSRLCEDVEQFKALEIQRRNFFTAVSHELKTPLTVLKGQLENMVLGFGDYKNHDKYLPQALDAAENIEYLVREILAISRMEVMNVEETLEDVPLWPMIHGCVRDISVLAGKKNIHIWCGQDEDLCVTVNYSLFKKALSNIIGNAVRHSPEGADVYIRLKNADGCPVLEVENTGVTLSDEDLAHMFTPFYRVDQSRSKATGGSGLGLYIVKTIMDLHHMSCHIENGPGCVRVTVGLPVQQP